MLMVSVMCEGIEVTYEGETKRSLKSRFNERQ